MTEQKQDYGLAERAQTQQEPAPALPYRPRDPRSYSPNIGLIGCGGISAQHLKAYVKAGYRVVALCDRTERKARQRQSEFYPRAEVFTDYRRLLDRGDIEVVDIVTHPHQRESIIEEAILAGKHMLSQKPFVTDLEFGQRMVELADQRGVRVAVNSNGRWAPHFSYLRQAVAHGLLGDVVAVHCSVHWNHNWIAGTEFDRVRHIILYDFGFHWFDILGCFMPQRTARRVYASLATAADQTARPPLLGQALVEYDRAQATLAFDGATRFGPEDRTCVVGNRGTIISSGPDLMEQTLRLYRGSGQSCPKLEGKWFPDGFHGTMGELLCAVEENREPYNSARGHLKSLELCFAAVASAEQHQPKIPGDVKFLVPGS